MDTANYLTFSAEEANKCSSENLKNKTILLIPDYYQKALPMAFQKGQCSNFSKKGMTQHAEALHKKYKDLCYLISKLCMLKE